ncbi:hypothetical protein BSKO_02266 [Bryopsis sp. KO-2023]|nr:hypothetical protein BSKO_02266 [Bryopsis sp. KO-2023]
MICDVLPSCSNTVLCCSSLTCWMDGHTMQEPVDHDANEATVSDDDSALEGVSPQEAAAQRALIRKKNLEASLGIETDFAPDITFAEEAYDDPSELFNEAGMPIEPFHLKREREDGYFDGDGNYVVFKFDEVKDAWVDSLEEGPLRERAKCGNIGDTTMDESDLEDIDLVDYKKNLTELLEDGETVVDGLRRLARRRDSDLETKELGKKAAKLLEKQRQVPAQNRLAFDKLTEYSSLLMAYGECNIYNLTKERMLEDIQKEMAESQQDENGQQLDQPSELDQKQLSPTGPTDDIDTLAKESLHGVAAEPNALPASNELTQETDNKMDASCNEDSDSGTTGPHETQPQETAAGQDGQTSNLEGYVFDSDSGKYYNSEKGYYYDPSTELYGNASTGVWYKLVNGAFEAV